MTRRQIAFDLEHRPATGLDDFIPGAANSRALDAVRGWLEWPHFCNLLIGPPGAGKTHLARIWAGLTGASAVDCRQVDIGRLGSGSPGRFLIEDIDRGPVDEVGLCHLLNHAHESAGAVLITARTSVARWQIGLEDLLSRLRAATVVEIGPPDDELLEAVLVKLLSDRQLEVADAAIKYAIRRMDRSLAAAGLLAERLDRLSLEEQAAITPRLVRRALDEPSPHFVS